MTPEEEPSQTEAAGEVAHPSSRGYPSEEVGPNRPLPEVEAGAFAVPPMVPVPATVVVEVAALHSPVGVGEPTLAEHSVELAPSAPVEDTDYPTAELGLDYRSAAPGQSSGRLRASVAPALGSLSTGLPD